MANDTNNSLFLGKDITIRKKSGSAVRGICIENNSFGISVKLENKSIFVAWENIDEILFGGD